MPPSSSSSTATSGSITIASKQIAETKVQRCDVLNILPSSKIAFKKRTLGKFFGPSMRWKVVPGLMTLGMCQFIRQLRAQGRCHCCSSFKASCKHCQTSLCKEFQPSSELSSTKSGMSAFPVFQIESLFYSSGSKFHICITQTLVLN